MKRKGICWLAKVTSLTDDQIENKNIQKHHVENKPSALLSHDENQMVVAMVGPRCQTLATTVAQVYRSEGPGHNYRWNKRTCGVICFVKDNLRRSYFIRVYDMDRTVLVFDQEIYNQFRLDCDCSQHPTE